MEAPLHFMGLFKANFDPLLKRHLEIDPQCLFLGRKGLILLRCLFSHNLYFFFKTYWLKFLGKLLNYGKENWSEFSDRKAPIGLIGNF